MVPCNYTVGKTRLAVKHQGVAKTLTKVTDHLGSTRALMEEDTSLYAWFGYDVLGQVTEQNGSCTNDADFGCQLALQFDQRFQGHQYLAWSNNSEGSQPGLVDNKDRLYSPEWGLRFDHTDVAGQSISPYTAYRDNPAMYLDRDGLQPFHFRYLNEKSLYVVTYWLRTLNIASKQYFSNELVNLSTRYNANQVRYDETHIKEFAFMTAYYKQLNHEPIENRKNIFERWEQEYLRAEQSAKDSRTPETFKYPISEPSGFKISATRNNSQYSIQFSVDAQSTELKSIQGRKVGLTQDSGAGLFARMFVYFGGREEVSSIDALWIDEQLSISNYATFRREYDTTRSKKWSAEQTFTGKMAWRFYGFAIASNQMVSNPNFKNPVSATFTKTPKMEHKPEFPLIDTDFGRINSAPSSEDDESSSGNNYAPSSEDDESGHPSKYKIFENAFM